MKMDVEESNHSFHSGKCSHLLKVMRNRKKKPSLSEEADLLLFIFITNTEEEKCLNCYKDQSKVLFILMEKALFISLRWLHDAYSMEMPLSLKWEDIYQEIKYKIPINTLQLQYNPKVLFAHRCTVPHLNCILFISGVTGQMQPGVGAVITVTQVFPI